MIHLKASFFRPTVGSIHKTDITATVYISEALCKIPIIFFGPPNGSTWLTNILPWHRSNLNCNKRGWPFQGSVSKDCILTLFFLLPSNGYKQARWTTTQLCNLFLVLWLRQNNMKRDLCYSHPHALWLLEEQYIPHPTHPCTFPLLLQLVQNVLFFLSYIWISFSFSCSLWIIGLSSLNGGWLSSRPSNSQARELYSITTSTRNPKNSSLGLTGCQSLSWTQRCPCR